MKLKVGVVIAICLSFIPSLSFADTDTATASLNIQLLKPLVDRAIPFNLLPAIDAAKSDRPKPYKDRCHTQQNLEKSTNACDYGDIQSKTTIILFGDSHALSWFPAIERLALAKHWHLESLTMSSCWPADIPAWNSTTNELMDNCPLWRADTLNDIIAFKPLMVFVAGTRGFATIDKNLKVATGDSRTAIWEAGMARTFAKLKKATQKIVYLSDTPISQYDVPLCLQQHRTSIENCSTPFAKAVSTSWLQEEKRVADIAGVTWIDPTPWICSTDPCSPLSGRYQIFVDMGHLTSSFAWTLEKPLWTSITST